MKILIRGGGDLASGVAVRLYRSHFNVLITEIEKPRVLRRTVAFATAVFDQAVSVEGITGLFVSTPAQLKKFDFSKKIPVFIDPIMENLDLINPDVIVDARMLKKEVQYSISKKSPLILGLGPGFTGGLNCHAAIETNRGHFLGRVLWDQKTMEDTGIPGTVAGKQNERVLRAPTTGVIQSKRKLGAILKKGDIVGYVNQLPVIAPFDGCLRGLMNNGLEVHENEKIGDLDPRSNPNLIKFVSEKSLAIAGGVLEAILAYHGGL